jgi:hypothetical protein
MKKVILSLIAFSAIAATAATARLGSAHLDADAHQAVIDVRSPSLLKEVSLAVSGDAVSVDEVTVVYRTGDGSGPYKSDRFRVNRVVGNGGAVTLELSDAGYPIRRIEIEGSSSGFNRGANITAYGSN